jgi:predicted ribosomally synthesized peptide with nif11-like leader
MAKEDVLKFWEKVSQDEELARKLEARIKPKSGWPAVVDFANANGFEFTTEDYAEAVKSLPKALGAEGFAAWKKGEKLELGDRELDQVAGGLALSSFSRLSQASAFSFQSPLRLILQPFGGVLPGGGFGPVA